MVINKIDIMIRKFILTIGVILSTFLFANAEETTDYFYIDDFTIAPGETKSIGLNLFNEESYIGLQLDIYLPEGLSIVYNEEADEYLVDGDRIPKKWAWDISFHEDENGAFCRVTAYSTDGKRVIEPFDPDEGAMLFEMLVKADEDMLEDGLIICKAGKLSRKVDGANVPFKTPDTECHVSVCRTASLADVVAGGIDQAKYMISDKLLAVAAAADQGILFCKDDNASASKTSKNEGQVDYMRDVVNEQKYEWDQSNWVALQFSAPDEENGISKMLSDAVGSYIKANTVVGFLSDINNYTITMSSDELQLEDEAPENAYAKNVYCIANFEPSNLNINGGQGAAGNYHGQDAYYFFMNPKVMEVCEITYAEWDGEKFVVPTNPARITGHVNVDWSYNEGGVQSPKENSNGYRFDAVVRRTEGSSYLRDDSTDPIIVYPLNFTSDGSELPTAINDVFAGNGIVKSVKYFNVAGIESGTPFQGVNIVVTEYTDGTRITTKMLHE